MKFRLSAPGQAGECGEMIFQVLHIRQPRRYKRSRKKALRIIKIVTLHSLMTIQLGKTTALRSGFFSFIDFICTVTYPNCEKINKSWSLLAQPIFLEPPEALCPGGLYYFITYFCKLLDSLDFVKDILRDSVCGFDKSCGGFLCVGGSAGDL